MGEAWQHCIGRRECAYVHVSFAVIPVYSNCMRGDSDQDWGGVMGAALMTCAKRARLGWSVASLSFSSVFSEAYSTAEEGALL